MASVDGLWATVAPGGEAVAWKEDAFTVVRTLPDGELIARVKSGWGIDLRFSPGGRWLSEMGEGVFRVFDRDEKYRVIGRAKMSVRRTPTQTWQTGQLPWRRPRTGGASTYGTSPVNR